MIKLNYNEVYSMVLSSSLSSRIRVWAEEIKLEVEDNDNESGLNVEFETLLKLNDALYRLFL